MLIQAIDFHSVHVFWCKLLLLIFLLFLLGRYIHTVAFATFALPDVDFSAERHVQNLLWPTTPGKHSFRHSREDLLTYPSATG